MRSLNFVFILFLLSAFNSIYGQWNKLPTQQLFPTYPETSTGGSPFNQYTIFPKILHPIGDGHILISSYHYNGSSSSYGIQNVIYETKDDFSSHNAVYQTTEAIESFFVRDDSSFSWHAKPVGPFFSTYYNKVALNSFQILDTFYLCGGAMPPDAFGTCLTDGFIYSIEHGAFSSGAQDTMRIGRSPLDNLTNLSCKKLPLYNVPVGSMNFLNDSVLFFDCVYKNNNSKKVILKTNDFGQTWNPIYVDSLNSVLSYKFTSENIGYVLLSNHNLIKTLDGGINWLPVTTPAAMLTCFGFFNDTIGYIGGNQGFLSKTIDGGQTWVNEISGSNYPLKEIFTVSNSVAYFKDSISALYKNTPILVSVRENNKSNGISVFPNPFNSIVNIESVKELRLITLYNVFGEIVLQINVKDNKTQIDLIKFAAGIYFVRIQDNYTRIIKE